MRCESAATFRPREAGEGDHWSSRSERTVVEGAPDSKLRCRCRRFLVARRSERAKMFEYCRNVCEALKPAPPPPRYARSPSPAARGRKEPLRRADAGEEGRHLGFQIVGARRQPCRPGGDLA